MKKEEMYYSVLKNNFINGDKIREHFDYSPTIWELGGAESELKRIMQKIENELSVKGYSEVFTIKEIGELLFWFL